MPDGRHPPARGEPYGGGMQSASVLVVEDDPSIRALVTEVLRDEGYDVQTANDGARAVDLILNDGLDLILLDLGLPVLDGMEVLRTMEAEDAGIPVVVVSARMDLKDALQAPNVVAAVEKPFDLDALVRTVRSSLRLGSA